MTNALEANINGYITNPDDRLLVILDNDSDIARDAVKKCCNAAGLKLACDSHYSSNQPIPTRNSPYFMDADVLMEHYIALLADLSNFDGVIEKALQFKDTNKKAVIVIGGFNVSKDSTWKDNERIIILDINSFDFWLNWAKSTEQHNRPNVHPLITNFLEQHPEWLEPCPGKGPKNVTTRLKWKHISDDIVDLIDIKSMYKNPEIYKDAQGRMLDDTTKRMLMRQLASGRVPNGWNSLDPNDLKDIERIIAMGAGVDAAAAFMAFYSK